MVKAEIKHCRVQSLLYLLEQKGRLKLSRLCDLVAPFVLILSTSMIDMLEVLLLDIIYIF